MLQKQVRAAFKVRWVRTVVFGAPPTPPPPFLTRRAPTAVVQPTLQLQQHAKKVDARLKTPLRLDPVRPEYHRAVVSWNSIAGRFDAASTGSQMSSR